RCYNHLHIVQSGVPVVPVLCPDHPASSSLKVGRVALLAAFLPFVLSRYRSPSFLLPESVEQFVIAVCLPRVALIVPVPYRGLLGRRISPDQYPPRYFVLPPRTVVLASAHHVRFVLPETQNLTRRMLGRVVVPALEVWLVVLVGLRR